MKKIQMVDLVSQYQPLKADIDAAIIQVIETASFVNGPEVQNFKKELAAYVGSKHCIPCANGTDALQIAMMALGLQPGDEVIAPTFTYVATVEVAALLHLRIVFVDAQTDTFNMDPEKIEAAITPKTKAIVPVHLYGQCSDMDPILAIAKKHNLFVIEDTAQAIGASFTSREGWTKKAGTMGTVGCTSFYPSKNLGCYGDGGAMFAQEDEIGDKLATIANHGQHRRYYHDEVGVNSRLDSMQAAVLRRKLPHLDEYNARRRKAADMYDAGFAGNKHLRTPFRAAYSDHVFHQYTLQVVGTDRDKLVEHLTAKQVPVSVFYPVALHLQNAFADMGYKQGDFPIAEDLTTRVFSLPMHSELDDDQVAYIIAAVNEYFN
jgi:UDP-2-acetamido-2-deoxy-ribo-hexuluronate aminotransferase